MKMSCGASFHLALLCLSTLSAFLSTSQAGLTDDKSLVQPYTDEKSFSGATPAQILSFLTSNPGYRLTTLRVQNPSPLTLSATAVPNTGPFQVPGWWWYYGVTFAQIGSYLTANNARLIDIDTYSSGSRFTIIMVSNTGSNARAWAWWVGLSFADLSNAASSVRFQRLNAWADNNGNRKYSVIGVSNSGPDQQAWWWYTGISPTDLITKLSANKARLTSIQFTPDGQAHAIMVGAPSPAWYWYFGQAASQLQQRLILTGGRFVDLSPQSQAANPVFSVAIIDNLNAEGSRLRNILWDGTSTSPVTSYGFSLKTLAGDILTQMNPDLAYEPASSIKIWYALYASYLVQNGLTVNGQVESMTNNVVIYGSPDDPTNKDVCPDPAWESAGPNAPNAFTLTLEQCIQKMMYVSDNRATRTLQKRYGSNTVTAWAHSYLGVSPVSAINQILGCGFQNNLHNFFTANDAAITYSSIMTKYSGAAQAQILADMADFGPGGLDSIISSEFTSAGVDPSLIPAYTAGIHIHAKGGSYNINGLNYWSGSGLVQFPVKKTDGSIQPQWFMATAYIQGVGATDQVKAAWNLLNPQLYTLAIRMTVSSWA